MPTTITNWMAANWLNHLSIGMVSLSLTVSHLLASNWYTTIYFGRRDQITNLHICQTFRSHILLQTNLFRLFCWQNKCLLNSSGFSYFAYSEKAIFANDHLKMDFSEEKKRKGRYQFTQVFPSWCRLHENDWIRFTYICSNRMMKWNVRQMCWKHMHEKMVSILFFPLKNLIWKQNFAGVCQLYFFRLALFVVSQREFYQLY